MEALQAVESIFKQTTAPGSAGTNPGAALATSHPKSSLIRARSGPDPIRSPARCLCSGPQTRLMSYRTGGLGKKGRIRHCSGGGFPSSGRPGMKITCDGDACSILLSLDIFYSFRADVKKSITSGCILSLGMKLAEQTTS